MAPGHASYLLNVPYAMAGATSADGGQGQVPSHIIGPTVHDTEYT